MTVIADTPATVPGGSSNAADHLWMHFTRMGSFATNPVPIVERGEGAYIYDSNGRRYLDALSGLFVVQVGYGRDEIADAADKQTRKLAYFPIWSYATPPAIELADRLAALAPGDLNKVFFPQAVGSLSRPRGRSPSSTSSSRQAAQDQGDQPRGLPTTARPRRLVDHRSPELQARFEPLVPGSHRVPNTDFYRAPDHLAEDEKTFGLWAANRVEEAILAEGPDSIAGVFVEPVQNAGGSIPPVPGYFERLREICDAYDVLLVSDEVICAYGRLGTMFGCDKFGYQPDIITSAKGMTSGYAALGAAIISDRIFEPFSTGTTSFAHGYTFGGHPVACAPPLPTSTCSRKRTCWARCYATRTPSVPPLTSFATCPSSVTSEATATSGQSSWSRTRRPRSRSLPTTVNVSFAASSPPVCGMPGFTAVPTTAARPSYSSPRR
jgi:adenosylmethionine-8-amino-7-oxononanoate aminotransferase